MSETGSGSRTEAIADALRAQILSGKYEAGERLPSERELAQRTGANRSSVREALKQLEHAGMIAIRPGGGARVLPLERAGLGVVQHMLTSQSPNRDFLAQWLDVHELVIAGATRFAMERATPEELAHAKRLLHKLTARNATAEEVVATADALTELIAVASRNVVLRMVRDALTSQARRHPHDQPLAGSARKRLLPIVRDIEQAMDARDPAAAEEAVRRLLRANRELLLGLAEAAEAPKH